jgi:[acyl-carrier-protein] S-malonyltransferase
MMLNVAYIFPGQGAQYVGMGEEFYRNCASARETFEHADSILGFNLSELIFKGPLTELTKTANCQLAVFVVSVVSLRAWQEAQPPVTVRFTAGLSLGEYTALVAAGALTFEDGLKLVQKRARYMQEASLKHPGGMLSLLGLPLTTVEDISARTKTEVANLNCPGQIVISGDLLSLEKAKQLAESLGAKKVIPLKVGGAFHSSLMAEAKQRLTDALEQVQVHPQKISVVSNVTAKEESQPEEIKENLARQIAGRIRWEDSINFIRSCGIRKFIEIGPGRVLKGLLRKIDPGLEVYNIESIADVQRSKEECKK